jgi:hypothetical protein
LAVPAVEERAMWEAREDAADAQRALDAHLAAMEAASVAIEDLLGVWAQEWCQATVDKAITGDAHRTQTLRAASTYGQMMHEVAQL